MPRPARAGRPSGSARGEGAGRGPTPSVGRSRGEDAAACDRYRSRLAGPGVVGDRAGGPPHQEPDQAAAPGDIAVIDHRDLDKVAAEPWSPAAPAAVVNASQSISGRYPNLGPGDDRGGRDPADRRRRRRRDDRPARRRPRSGYATGSSTSGTPSVASGTVQDLAESVTAAMDEARAGLAVQLEAFVDEHDGLAAARAGPAARRRRGARDPHRLYGRPVLIVVRGLPLPRGPGHAAALHPGEPPGADRGRRRCRRHPRGRLHPGPGGRRHGLGHATGR